MEVIITALGPDNVGLADPIIHHVTGRGARIAEIQMYDHDEEQLFAMLCRIDIDSAEFERLSTAMRQIGDQTGLAIRVWSSERRAAASTVGDLLHVRRTHAACGLAGHQR